MMAKRCLGTQPCSPYACFTWGAFPRKNCCEETMSCKCGHGHMLHLVQCPWPLTQKLTLTPSVLRLSSKNRIHRSMESLQLEKTSKTPKSNHQPNTTTTFTTKPCPQVPQPHIFDAFRGILRFCPSHCYFSPHADTQ